MLLTESKVNLTPAPCLHGLGAMAQSREFVTQYVVPRSRERSLSTEILQGISVGLPIVMGYVPVGFAYGVLAASSGLPAYFAIGLCVFTYAGSAQFMALGLLTQGASVSSIAFATLIINARYLLMSTAMLKYIRKWPSLERVIFAAEMTDETFVLNCVRFETYRDSKTQIYTTHAVVHLSWVVGTAIGYFANSLLPDPSAIGLDFALIALFVGLLAPQLRSSSKVCAALFSVGTYILLQLTPMKSWAILVSPIVGALLMGMEDLWQTKN